MAQSKRNIIFLYNGAPLPAMLEMISRAQELGMNPLLVLLDRGDRRLIVDSTLIDYDVLRINVRYRSVEVARVLSVPSQFRKIRSIIKNELEVGGTIVTSSLDMLLIARLATMFGDYDIRHQVRDLHALQLEKGLRSSLLRFIERLLLRRVSKVVVSSPKFASEYYDRLYSGEIVLLENVPQAVVWKGFERRRCDDGVFVIGYIGILRYKESLYRLIETVERMVNEGFRIKVVFAGGGSPENLADIQGRITVEDAFSFSGPYEYARDIKGLYKDVDLIYAVYDEHNLNCQLAMPNKFYESILSGIPILVARNTFVGEETERHGIGQVVSVDEPDNLYSVLRDVFEAESWYTSASQALETTSPAKLYADYDRALRRSVA